MILVLIIHIRCTQRFYFRSSFIPYLYIYGLLWTIKYAKVHHFVDDTNLNFSSSIKLINKYIANSRNENQENV